MQRSNTHSVPMVRLPAANGGSHYLPVWLPVRGTRRGTLAVVVPTIGAHAPRLQATRPC